MEKDGIGRGRKDMGCCVRMFSLNIGNSSVHVFVCVCICV